MRRGGKKYSALLGASLVLSLAAGPAWNTAWAQPIRLTPNGAAPNTAPNSSEPAQPAPSQPAPVQGNTLPAQMPSQIPAAPRAAEKPDEKPDGVVRIETLKAPDPSSAGLLTIETGGLGARMWANTSRAQAERALRILPAPVLSPGLRDLQRRLLLSTAEIPAGEIPPGETPPGTAASILGLRVEQLLRLGLVAEATQLGSPKPAALKDSVFDRLPLQQMLLRNDLNGACELGTAGLREDPTSNAWLRLAVVCRYRANDIAGGDLALSLWREQEPGNTAFQALAAALRGDSHAKIESLGDAPILGLAMLRAAKRPLTAALLKDAPPALLAAAAENGETDAETRLAALENAARYGAVSPARLAQGYMRAEIPEAERAEIAKGKSARAAALLFQQARALTLGSARGEALLKLHDLARERGLFIVTAQALRESLRDLPPGAEVNEAALAVIRLALAAGETGTARLWRNTLLTQGGAEGAKLALKVWPLMLLADPPTGAWPADAWRAWSGSLADLPAAERGRRYALVLVLAEASGIAVPAAAWQELLSPGMAGDMSGNAIYWRNLLRAMEADAKAESVALSLALLGSDGLAKGDAADLATMLGALRRLQMPAEARALALEAALSRPL